MGLLLDVSTPSAVTTSPVDTSGVPQTITTAAFTAPVGAVLVIVFFTNSPSGTTTISSMSVTDNRASHLTYTFSQRFGNATSDSQVSLWSSSSVPAAISMTVSASYTDSSTTVGGNPSMLRVLVFTGADTSAPIGAKGGNRGVAAQITVSYVSTRTGSWGWIGCGDWAQTGVPAVTGAESVDSSYDVAGQDTYALVKQNVVSGSTGSTVTMSTATPSSGGQISYNYFEVVPALVSPSIGSVPSGTALTTPALSAKFLYFDTGDYGIGV